MKLLKISSELALPTDRAVAERIGFLGRPGQGKSYAAMLLAELMHAAQAQFVALDPVGIWWGLRLAADGKSPGLEIPVFGGLQGDLPLEPTAGGLLADLIVDRGVSAVLDVSQFESDADRIRFSEEFGKRLFFRKKSAKSPLHLFLEEAQEFLPQHPVGRESFMLAAFTRIAKIGRNFGFGLSLISQRPQEVNKKALNLVELLFAFQLTGKHERKAIVDWIHDKGVDADIDAILPKLEIGCPHAWSPSWLKISEVVPIGKRWTFNASSTPKVGARQQVVKALTPIDLVQLQSDMAATIERAKADDPKLLRKRIAELERQAKAGKSDPKAIEAAEARGEARARKAAEQEIKQLRAAIGDREGRLGKIEKLAHLNGAALAQFSGPAETVSHAAQKPRETKPQSAGPISAPRRELSRRATGAAGDASGVDTAAALGKGAMTVLTAIAQNAAYGTSSEQISVLTGYKKTSKGEFLRQLKAAGYVAEEGQQYYATGDGLAALGDDFEPLPTGGALRAYWLGKLSGGEQTFLRHLIDGYPESFDLQTLMERTAYQKTSAGEYLRKLVARKLATRDRGVYRAADHLFD